MELTKELLIKYSEIEEELLKRAYLFQRESQGEPFMEYNISIEGDIERVDIGDDKENISIVTHEEWDGQLYYNMSIEDFLGNIPTYWENKKSQKIKTLEEKQKLQEVYRKALEEKEIENEKKLFKELNLKYGLTGEI